MHIKRMFEGRVSMFASDEVFFVGANVVPAAERPVWPLGKFIAVYPANTEAAPAKLLRGFVNFGAKRIGFLRCRGAGYRSGRKNCF